MIHDQHYPAEKHILKTSDGYMLTVYRIPNMNMQRSNSKVVLLMHGMILNELFKFQVFRAFVRCLKQFCCFEKLSKFGMNICFLNEYTGMTSAAPAFLTFGRDTSAAYKFADAGYDVIKILCVAPWHRINICHYCFRFGSAMQEAILIRGDMLQCSQKIQSFGILVGMKLACTIFLQRLITFWSIQIKLNFHMSVTPKVRIWNMHIDTNRHQPRPISS